MRSEEVTTGSIGGQAVRRKAWYAAPQVRRFVLLLHVVSSVGWLGLNLGVPALAITGMTTADPEVQHAVYRVLGLLGDLYLIPLSLTAFITGVLLSLMTTWGLLRHYWVIAKFALTLIAVVLIPASLLPGLHAAAEAVASTPPGTFAAIPRDGVGQVGAGFVSTTMYVTCAVLSIYKPWGRTPFGRRRLALSGASRAGSP
ncbi:hypothetical protein DP939_06545 [Spongiactinospora rosea]|uniref:DUF2269 domain-containing protein n=1 Tax=Spongiactinospora rosea TaxID=2248750 RepID=A0A366M4H9_9ACTN|nr:DUF2269 family protein [Spongiactinospora rosea]RBQ20733.1 hypothetical protein DP939_06545 [Spongiactinospora rosea]